MGELCHGGEVDDSAYIQAVTAASLRRLEDPPSSNTVVNKDEENDRSACA